MTGHFRRFALASLGPNPKQRDPCEAAAEPRACRLARTVANILALWPVKSHSDFLCRCSFTLPVT